MTGLRYRALISVMAYTFTRAAGIADESDGPLFRTTGRKIGHAHATWQQDVCRMIQRRAAADGIKTKIGNRTFRATCITTYLKNKGLLEQRANDCQPCLAEYHEAL
jgi:hypothetical protein